MKKGFTLVEIIISIGLILLIGAVSLLSYNWIDKKNTLKTLESMKHEILTAANVYMEAEGVVKDKVYEEGEAVVIPLNLLVKEGLLDIEGTTLEDEDLEDEYIVSALTGSFGPDDCIDITTNTSWTLSDDNPLYICTEVSSEEVEDLKNEIKELKEKIAELESKSGSGDTVKDALKVETLYAELSYTAKGAIPNNWVEFEVESDSSKVAYFPNDTDKNLWRIVSINGDGEIKLFYPKPIPCNNDLMYDTAQSNYTGTASSGYTYYYKLKAFNSGTGHFPSSEYYLYDSKEKWNATELSINVDVANSKQEALYNAISKKNWIVESNYNPYYSAAFTITAGTVLQSTTSVPLKIGMISQNEITSSIDVGDSWLYDYSTLIGWGTLYYRLDEWTAEMYSNYGNIHYDTAGWEAKSTRWTFTTHDFHPVITLNEKVDLVKQTCLEGMELGSKDCPYKLKCDGC